MDKYAFAISDASVLLIVGVAVQFWFAARLFVLSHAMFMAVGAYTAVVLGERGVPLPLVLVASIGLTLVSAGVVAPLLLRLQSLQLALASLALSSLAAILLLKWESLTGGANGRFLPVTMGWQSLLLVALAVLTFSWWIQRRWQGPLSVLRYDPRVAESMGLNALAYQRAFFIMGAGIAGLAGGLQSQYLLYMSASTFSFELILMGLIVAVLGAREHWFGPVIGVLVMGVLPEFFRALEQYSVMAAGILLILVMQYFPMGVVPPVVDAFRRFRARGRSTAIQDHVGAADPRGILDAARASSTAPARLEVNDLTVRYGGIAAVNGLSFAVEPGEVMGIVGPNGAGKTTLINALTGFVQLAEGSISLGGQDISSESTAQRARRGLIRTFQHAQFAPDLTLGENMVAGSMCHFRAPLGLNQSWPGVKRKHPELASAFGIERSFSVDPDSAPLGTRRVAEVGRALLARPSILLLDEPTAGMDDEALEQFSGVVQAAAAAGIGIILISHDIDVVQRVCDRIFVMSFGEEVATLPATELLSDERVIQAYLGAPA